MSTDWTVVCKACFAYHHLGQRADGVVAFGCGQHDREGRDAAARFVDEHIHHGSPGPEKMRATPPASRPATTSWPV